MARNDAAAAVPPYLTDEQIQKLRQLIARERALAGQLSGDRFEDILQTVLADCVKKKVNARGDKKWFDLAQPGRGLEVKTYQVPDARITPGSAVSNVLKRVAPSLISKKYTSGSGRDVQVDMSKPAAEVGAAVLEYLNTSVRTHAAEKGIEGDFYFTVLLRNKDLTHVGYWEQRIDFGTASDYTWAWSDAALKARHKGVEVFSWYCTGQRQLFYRFEAPAGVQVFDIPLVTGRYVSDEELQALFKEVRDKAYQEGLAEGLRRRGK